jgi:hypothetical protein
LLRLVAGRLEHAETARGYVNQKLQGAEFPETAAIDRALAGRRGFPGR